MCHSVVNYFNPFSNPFKAARKDFSELALTRKIVVVAAGIFGGLVTPFFLFTGFFAGFQVAVKWLKKGDNPISDKVHKTAGSAIPIRNETNSRQPTKTNARVSSTKSPVVQEFTNCTQGTSKVISNDTGPLQGRVKATLVDGSVYAGEFDQGLLNGVGRAVLANGTSVYEGEFQRGQICGKGVLTCSSGIFEGEFQGFFLHGKGKLTLMDGVVYEGEFDGGWLHGLVDVTYLDGTKEQVQYSQGNGLYHRS